MNLPAATFPSPELLDLLRCPLTRQRLRAAPPELLARWQPPLVAALVREDGAVLYPVVQGIPQLRPGDALPVPAAAG